MLILKVSSGFKLCHLPQLGNKDGSQNEPLRPEDFTVRRAEAPSSFVLRGLPKGPPHFPALWGSDTFSQAGIKMTCTPA